MGGVDFEIPIVFDATRLLGVPAIQLFSATTARVEVRVGRVEGAAYYDARLREVEAAPHRWVTSAAFESSSKAFVFTDLDLDPARTYEVLVMASTAPAPWDPYLVPQQVDRSTALSNTFTPEPAGD